MSTAMLMVMAAAANADGPPRYWRVRIVSVTSGAVTNGYTALAEVQMAASTGGATVPPTSITATSSLGASNGPDKLIDNNINSLWGSNGTTMPQDIVLDFAGGLGVREIRIGQSNNPTAFSPVAVEFAYSRDASAWTTVGNVSNLSTAVGANAVGAFAIPAI